MCTFRQFPDVSEVSGRFYTFRQFPDVSVVSGLLNFTGIEAAMNWVMEHMGDPDFSDPFSPPNASGAPAEEPVNEEHLGMIISMGFTLNQAKKALKVNVIEYCRSVYSCSAK